MDKKLKPIKFEGIVWLEGITASGELGDEQEAYSFDSCNHTNVNAEHFDLRVESSDIPYDTSQQLKERLKKEYIIFKVTIVEQRRHRKNKKKSKK